VSFLLDVVRLKLIVYGTTTPAAAATTTTKIPRVQGIKSRCFPRIHCRFERDANFKWSLERQRIKQDTILTV
jgi:hypothetical protein